MLPPITMKSFNFDPSFSSNLKARATFVNGPTATSVISPATYNHSCLLKYVSVK